MTWLIGVDEAGYGPNLGPLAIGLSAWRLPDGASPREVELYDWLSAVVSRSAADDRIAIADSKLLYKPGGGLAALERAVHGVLSADEQCDSFQSLLRELRADSENRRSTLPWHVDFNQSLPVNESPEAIAKLRSRLADACRSRDVAPPVIRARLVFPAELNDLIAHYGTKGAALSHITIGLVREVYDLLGGPCSCVCDKHGGRNRYGALLQHHFPEHWVETHAESRAQSRYSWGPPDARVEFAFRTGGEEFLPTALASMTAKYLRELSMLAFNTYWQEKSPGLKPTAGYPVDAKRFRADIAHLQKKLRIDDHVLWRNK